MYQNIVIYHYYAEHHKKIIYIIEWNICTEINNVLCTLRFLCSSYDKRTCLMSVHTIKGINRDNTNYWTVYVATVCS